MDKHDSALRAGLAEASPAPSPESAATPPVSPLKVKRSLSDELRRLTTEAGGQALSIGAILDLLSERSHAILLVLISFPFCQPVSLLGLSTPLGLVLAFVGLCLFLERKPWLPRVLRERQVPYARLSKWVEKMLPGAKKLERVLKPRLPRLCNDPVLRRVHGLFVIVMALLLCLPVPVPGTNMAAAIPMLVMGLGLLENDGVFIVTAYAAGLICIAYFGGLLWLGEAGSSFVFRSVT